MCWCRPPIQAPALSTNHHRIQDSFWSALSNHLTELSVIITPDGSEPLRIDVLNQLSKLTNLTLGMSGVDDVTDTIYDIPISHSSLPRLESVRMKDFTAKDVDLLCPRLRSLYLEQCPTKGKLFLPPSLEESKITGKSGSLSFIDEASAVHNLLGLTSLIFYGSSDPEQDLLYKVLPSMSVLRHLELRSDEGQLPPLLPVSLRVIRYYLNGRTPLSSRELQRFAAACQLPALQRMSLDNPYIWLPYELEDLKQVQAESKAKVIVKENCHGHSRLW